MSLYGTQFSFNGFGGVLATEIVSGSVWRYDVGAETGLNDDDAVATLTDQGDNNRDFTQSTESKKPIYKTNIVNSLPVLRFTAANSSHMTATSSVSDPVTEWYVLSMRNTDATYVWHDVTNQHTNVTLNTGEIRVVENGTLDDTGLNVTAGTFHVIMIEWAGSNVVKVRLDSSAEFSGTVGSTTYSNRWLGCNRLQTVFSDVDIAEVVYFNSSQSDADKSQMISYFNDKYGL